MENNKIMEIIKNKGATLDRNLNDFKRNKGYIVSLEGQEKKIIKSNIEEIKKEIEEKRKFIENRKGLYIGLWLENDYIYIDISIYIEDKTEALEIAKKNKQLAIYDLKIKDSLYLKDYSFVKYYTIYKIVRDKEGNIVNYEVDTQKNSINDLVDYFKLNVKTIKNSIYNELQVNNVYSQLINGQYVIIKDFELVES